MKSADAGEINDSWAPAKSTNNNSTQKSVTGYLKRFAAYVDIEKKKPTTGRDGARLKKLRRPLTQMSDQSLYEAFMKKAKLL